MTSYETLRNQLVEDGQLRVAINLGNAALATRDEATGELGGITVALAQRLCAALGCAPDFVVFEGAGAMVDAAGEGAWRIAFCAIDPERADAIVFTPPYVLIEAGAVVRTSSALRSVDELDAAGTTLMVARNSAYDLNLTKRAEAMTLKREPSPGASFEAFKADPASADAVAGVMQSLEKAFGSDPDYRFLNGAIASIGQAMAMPKAFAHLGEELTRFVEDAKADGFVRRELDRAGQRTLKVAPAA